jgi:hypothetical protein
VTEGQRRFRKLGFPDGTTVHALAASEPGRCLVATISAAGAGKHQLRLFVRGFDETHYDEIPWPEGCNGFDVPVLSSTAPILYTIASRWRAGGGDPVSLCRFKLPERRLDLVHAAHARIPREGGVGSTWLTQLLGFAADGRRLVVTRAVQTATDSSQRVDYSVCIVDPESGAAEELASLPAVFA